MPQSTVVTFANRKGVKLFGILEMPDAPASRDLAVLMLSPGVKMRVGPYGLYRRMADEFLELGLAVLRFDCYGLGDSEGTLPEALLRDVYNHIEVGRFVDDTIDAMNWMEREHGTRRFILSGLCGGAITGLLAGEHDDRVVGLLGIGLTAVLASRAADASRYMTQGQVEGFRRIYLRRLLSSQAWYRLLTFKADYRLIGRLITYRKRPVQSATATAAPPAANDNANPRFPPAFFSMLSRKRPMLLIFGGSDRLQFEFEEKFVSRYRERLAALPPFYKVHVVPAANHVLSASEWQREMLDVSRTWLQSHFAPSLAVTGTARSA
jgi:pimeloyl-ACP methyl ester carboxylesterase